MKILFVMASAEYLRYYDETIRLLASRGHDVVIAVNHDRGDRKPVKLDGMAQELQARVSVIGVLPTHVPWWGRVAKGLRGTMDFVRYLDPRFTDAHALRARIKRKVLPRWLYPLDLIPSLGRGGTRRAERILARLERSIPTAPALDAIITGLAPDAIVVSPLVDAASPQVDTVKTARKLGIPVAVGIASWDNLTNKGLLRIEPDLVILWNEIQKAEAVEMHGIAPERVVVTGAQLFDRWFDRAPSRPAEDFCRRVGFPAAAPFVLFTGSSSFISEATAEMAFVRQWIRSLRESRDPAVRGMPILVRPHPYNGAAWATADVSDLPGVVVWPRGSYSPVDEQNRADYFDSMYHSAAVVGINTSAMIEAAIVGRPVLSIHAREFAGTQDGTLHFHYLLPENGGFLRVAATIEEHVQQLAGVLADPGGVRQEIDRFVDRFIRPRGRATPATPAVADAIESLARRPTPAWREASFDPAKPVVWMLAALGALAEAVSARGRGRARKAARMRWHHARKAITRMARTGS